MRKFLILIVFLINFQELLSAEIIILEKSNNKTATDQDRCQAEADYMAKNNIKGHVWGCIGHFEGVGYGMSPNCSTCRPSKAMRLTGDACSQGRNGMWYRVRSWR
jgi:hypothetical protein